MKMASVGSGVAFFPFNVVSISFNDEYASIASPKFLTNQHASEGGSVFNDWFR